MVMTWLRLAVAVLLKQAVIAVKIHRRWSKAIIFYVEFQTLFTPEAKG